MNDTSFLLWLIRAALGGGLVLLVAWWRIRHIDSPARRQRLGEWALAAALVVALLSIAPGWITIPLPSLSPSVSEPVPAPDPVPEPVVNLPDEVFVWDEFPELLPQPSTPDEQPIEPARGGLSLDWSFLTSMIVRGYALIALSLLAWWLLGHLALWWLLRERVSPTVRLITLWRESVGNRRVRLRISRRVRVPFSYGVFCPTVVMPASLLRSASDAELRWVLRHELGHLDRCDSLGGALFGIGQCVFFYLPWFWWLRHEVRLSQEYLADQSALEAGGDRIDYADFLAGWAKVPGLPVGVPAVTGQGSDLFRRIRMLLERRVSLESRCPRRWSFAVAGGLLALAVLLGGVGPAVLAEDRKPEDRRTDPAQKTEDSKSKDSKKNVPEKRKEKTRLALPDIDELLKNLPADLDDKQKAMIKRQLDEALKKADDVLRMNKALETEYARRAAQLSDLFKRGRLPTDPVLRSPIDRLGAKFVSPSPLLIEQLSLPKGQGLVVTEVTKGAPAEKAGLKINDIVLEFDGKPVADKSETLSRTLASIEGNKSVDVVVLRKGKKETLKGLKLLPTRVDRTVESSMLNLQRTGVQFTLVSREGMKTIQVRGKLIEGKAKASSVQITQGEVTTTYTDVNQIPGESYNEVKALLEMCEKSVVIKKAK